MSQLIKKFSFKIQPSDPQSKPSITVDEIDGEESNVAGDKKKLVKKSPRKFSRNVFHLTVEIPETATAPAVEKPPMEDTTPLPIIPSPEDSSSSHVVHPPPQQKQSKKRKSGILAKIRSLFKYC